MSVKGRAFLFLEGGRKVYRCQFTKDLTLIGSGQSNDIVIRDESVQESHAQITRADDVYTLRPLDGGEVRVDDAEVESAYELMNGNRIEIGDAEMLFVREHAESPTTVHLIIRQANAPAMGFWTAKSTIVIGREKGDIILDDPLLSKVHAIVENFCEGGQYLLDARSELGTGLNGESIDARHRLYDGDIITVGGAEIEFRANPFGNAAGVDAAKLAEEQIAALRELDRTGSKAKTAEEPKLRNPYQRYPSSPADLDNRDDSQPLTTAPKEGAPPRSSRRRRGMDLRSGVQTGIVDVVRAASRAQSRPQRTPRRDESARLPSKSNPDRPEPTYQPADLPNFEPRPHWGGDDKAKGFGGRRSEMDTRLNRGNVDDSGLWYLPPTGEENKPAQELEKPIIRARGDDVPKPPPDQPAQTPGSRHKAQGQARIRRPAAGSESIRPMVSKDIPVPARVQEPSRYTPDPVPVPNAGDPIAPDVGGKSGPGARPEEQERWYIPGEKRKQVRQRKSASDQPWYIPDSQGNRDPSEQDLDDEYGERHERPAPKGGGGKTQALETD